ncbi:MAG: SDR family oxidoreductase [Vicinamibacteria bacterium]|nr:SDR family oxidoreductase [Vicinamibacteria bacterium]
MNLTSRHALVTGGGRGIGRAVALDLARAAAAVTVTARTRAEIDAVAVEIRAAGGRAAAVALDVSRADAVARAFAEARAALGPIDVLVNAAGVAPSAPLVKTDEAAWRAAIETNLSGAFYCMREALPEMSARGWGRVVNVASIAGKTGSPYIAAYAASKHGVLGLTRVAALEHAKQGVTVNAVCPGYVDTPMTDVSIARVVAKTGRPAEEVRRRIEEMSPQGRLYTSEEVAALVLFLCSDAARGINGQALSVDGGTVLA